MSFFPRSSKLVSVASAFPPDEFTQEEVGQLLGVTNPVVHKLLSAPHIKTRRLMLPRQSAPLAKETLPDLNRRFQEGIRTFGLEAASKALEQAEVSPQQVDVLVTVTSSGLALPGLSAILIKELGVNRKAHRSDLVGMGCNAGMSGLRTLNQLLAAHRPGAVGLLLCVEVSSALYKNDDTVGTGIVNSLFGDAAVATVCRAGDAHSPPSSAGLSPTLSSACSDSAGCDSPTLQLPPAVSSALPTHVALLDFEAHTFPDYFVDMRYDVDEVEGLYNFKLSKRIPEAVGNAVAEPVTELLERHDLEPADITHWVVHSGGAAVMDGVVKNLGLADDALRHTRSVLRDYGNISSGSFLVSYERLLSENRSKGSVITPGDLVCFIAMGPGTTIEVGLGRFETY